MWSFSGIRHVDLGIRWGWLRTPALCVQVAWFPTVYLTPLKQYKETMFPTLMQRDNILCWQLVFAARLLQSCSGRINILMNTALCSRDSIRDIHLHNSSTKKPQRRLDSTVPHTLHKLHHLLTRHLALSALNPHSSPGRLHRTCMRAGCILRQGYLWKL